MRPDDEVILAKVAAGAHVDKVLVLVIRGESQLPSRIRAQLDAATAGIRCVSHSASRPGGRGIF